MNMFEAVSLGVLQGIAEFLPVSSSGHLAVSKALFGLGDIPLLFDILLHLATLAAVLFVFRFRIIEIIVSLFRWASRKAGPADSDNLRLTAAILIGTFFTGVIGIGIEKLGLDGNLKLVSVCFIVTALLLIVSERLSRRASLAGKPGRSPGAREGVIVGIAQGIGVLPGISRSGITISASLASGVDREKAGEFSFLLSVPAILGAFILEFKDADNLMEQADLAVIAAGCIAAFLSGLFALKVLLSLIKRGRLSWFAAYLIPLGVVSFFFL